MSDGVLVFAAAFVSFRYLELFFAILCRNIRKGIGYMPQAANARTCFRGGMGVDRNYKISPENM